MNLTSFTLMLSLFVGTACVSSVVANNSIIDLPKLNANLLRPWSYSLAAEYPREKAVIAHYTKGDYQLSYLAARHTNTMGQDTLNLVEDLFEQFEFDVLLIEPFPFSFGESPKWYVEEAKAGRKPTFIAGGESALAVIKADEKRIPFFAGEPDPLVVFQGLKNHGYSDKDILGFFTVRQIPQWVRQRKELDGLLAREIPPFVANQCRQLSIVKCPVYSEIMAWYKANMGEELTAQVSNEVVAPVAEGTLLTQKISCQVGFIRDRFTLGTIERLLHKYKRVAVIYGAGHFFTLRQSLEQALGAPRFVEDVRTSLSGSQELKNGK